MNKTKLSGDKRRKYVTRIFDDACFYMMIKPHIHSMANMLSKDYDGGFWASYKTDNGAFYTAPESNQRFQVESPNGSIQIMSADAFGVAVTLFTYSHLSFHFKATSRDKFASNVSEQYHLLTDYADAHDEAAAIYEICN